MRLRIRVESGTALPLADARLWLASPTVDLPDIAALTDAEGRATVSLPEAGEYTVMCSAPGYAEQRRVIRAEAGEEEGAALELVIQIV